MKSKVSVSGVLIAGYLLISCLVVWSGEVKFPTPSYEGEELAKVKEWEKTWAGKKVTSANVDQVKDLLSEAVYTIMKNPKNFGADEIWFEVVPYRPYKVSKGLIESTLKYAPQAKLEENMALANYGSVAGIPFPQPDLSDPVVAGTQMAWNFDGYTHGDSSYIINRPANIIDCRTGLERSAGQHRWELYWAGRHDVPPTPELPKNKRGVHRTYFQRHSDPPDFADTGVLEVKYKDITRDCDLWIYTAMFRRIRRYTTKQRTDMIDGTDLIYDDNHGWYTHITNNNYEDPYQKLTRKTGQGFWSGVQRERVKCWVIEAVNKDPKYVYSKRVWYLDPENWQMNAQRIYDRQGKLWKYFEFGYNEYPGYGGELVTITNAEHWVDLIRRHGSVGQYEIKEVGIDLPKQMFSIAALQQQTY
ncbi:MAG: DUF1329 domain-containing protein [Deltaproteobacteria bacterium]|nr:DUF1329 domain-containing protein [Deltaproteobacteria bacterium]